VPLEVAPADWHDHLETVELDSEFDEIERQPIEFLSSPTLLRDRSHCDDTDESPCLVHGVERNPTTAREDSRCTPARAPRLKKWATTDPADSAER